MKRLIALVIVVAVASVVLSAQRAEAIKPFSDEFLKLYVKQDSADPKEKALADAVAKIKCNVCHEGTQKKNRNAYGKALDELLDKKADAKDTAKIQDALKKVEAMHSKAGDDKSPTFGDLIKEGKLPCGE